LVLLDNAVSALSIPVNGPFIFSAPISSGSTYAVTVGTKPTPPSSSKPQTCAVRSGAGTLTSANVATVLVTCLDNAARFLYLTNSGSNTISAYSINTTTGALTGLSGSPFATGVAPVALTIHPGGKFAYVLNGGGQQRVCVHA
jgi:6-phosphogluconolactonase